MPEKYANLVEKYTQKFGEAWEARAPGIIDKVLAAIETQDFGYLRQLSYVKQNPFSREIFVLLTGIKLPATQRGTLVALETYCGAEKVRAWQESRASQKIERQAERRGKYLKDLPRQVDLARRVIHDGVQMSYSEFIRALVRQGYNHLEEAQNGATIVYRLSNAQCTFYCFRRTRERDSIKSLLGLPLDKEEATVAPIAISKPPRPDVQLYERKLLECSREVVAAVILHSNGQFLPIEGDYKYLIGKTRFGNAVALVWDEDETKKGCLAKEAWAEISKETQAAGLKGQKHRVFGRFALVQSKSLEFIQIPILS